MNRKTSMEKCHGPMTPYSELIISNKYIMMSRWQIWRNAGLWTRRYRTWRWNYRRRGRPRNRSSAARPWTIRWGFRSRSGRGNTWWSSESTRLLAVGRGETLSVPLGCPKVSFFIYVFSTNSFVLCLVEGILEISGLFCLRPSFLKYSMGANFLGRVRERECYTRTPGLFL